MLERERALQFGSKLNDDGSSRSGIETRIANCNNQRQKRVSAMDLHLLHLHLQK